MSIEGWQMNQSQPVITYSQYLHNIPCLFIFLVKALTIGTELAAARFTAGSECVTREYEKTRHIMEILGIRKNRLALIELPAFDGQRIVAEITEFFDNIKALPAGRSRKTGLKVA